MKTVEVRHPLVAHKLGLLRDAATGPALFRQVVGEIATLLAYEATADLALGTRRIDTWEELKAFFTAANPERPEIHGGFALCHWNGSAEVEKRLKEELKVTIRCIPLDAPAEAGKCVVTGEPSARRVVMAKAY